MGENGHWSNLRCFVAVFAVFRRRDLRHFDETMCDEQKIDKKEESMTNRENPTILILKGYSVDEMIDVASCGNSKA